MAHRANLDQLKEVMRRVGVRQLYFKRLANNDNSKNQVYLGPDFSAMNVLPAGELVANATNRKMLKAQLNFSWLTPNGELIHSAPSAADSLPSIP